MDFFRGLAVDSGVIIFEDLAIISGELFLVKFIMNDTMQQNKDTMSTPTPPSLSPIVTKPINYVNNQDFYKCIVQYKKDCRLAKRNKQPKPRIPDYVGKCLLLIAENLSHKLNFNSYTFRDEMCGDGIENCIMYFDNFDTKKYKNPFAYFTQIIYYAFLRRILREKKQLYTKYVLTQQFGVLGDLETPDNDDGTNRQQFELYENISDFIGKFEEVKKRKKKNAAAKKRLTK